jgi:metabolite-proton symporter
MAQRDKRTSNSVGQIIVASMAGTTIEFFDFYIYATAAVLIFPRLFFPESAPTTAVLQSLATFAVAFFARPVGSALFGHFGDRHSRKATLVASLLTMGLATVAVGLLPGYAEIGVWAPALLVLCRFCQGLGLGGEWGGAVLLATENAPPGKRAWYGMFPQLGAPFGFLLSAGAFLWLSDGMSEQALFAWGWRLPFLASAALVAVGLYVRLKLEETPVFKQVLERGQRVRVPALEVFRAHLRALVLGTAVAIATFLLFYLGTVFALNWGIAHLGYSRSEFLLLELVSMLFFAGAIPISALITERAGRRRTMVWVTVAILAFGLAFAPLFGAGNLWAVLASLIIAMTLMGLTYGPLGTVLSEYFPARVRYTGTSVSFNLAGIFGASLAPTLATWLALHHGLWAVGAYLALAAAITLAALLATRETGQDDYAR